MIPSLPFDPPSQPLAPYSGRTPTARACSRAASLAATAFAPTQRERVLAHYRACGTRGATDPEVSDATGISRQSLCQRRAELMRTGYLIESQRTRRHRTGCACTVYVVTEAAGP